MSQPLGPPPSGPPPPGPPPGWTPYPQPPPPPPPRRRGRAVLAVGAAVLVAVLAVAAVLVVPGLVTDDGGLRTGGSAGSGEGEDGEEGQDGDASLDDVRLFDDLPTTHLTGEIDYPESPTVGGEHNPIWLDCGVYDEVLPEENVGHDLEHGTLWLTYDPDADVDLDALAERLPQNGIMSPYPDLRAPVVATVWGAQIDLEGPDDPRLDLFVETYGNSETAPEPFATCAGGATLDELDDLLEQQDGGGSSDVTDA